MTYFTRTRRNLAWFRIALVLGALLGLALAAWAQVSQVIGDSPVKGGPLTLPSSVDQYTLVLGVLLPLAIAAINREAWTAPLKSAAALGICVVAAALELVVKGQFDMKHLGTNLLAIFFLVVTTYAGFWKPTGITDAVGKATG